MLSADGIRFSAVRMALGVYLAHEFATVGLVSELLFGATGPLGSLDALAPPWILSARSCLAYPIVPLGFAATALVLAIGFYRRQCAFILLAGWVLLVNGIPTISVPSDGFVGWLVLTMAIVPPGEPRLPVISRVEWQLPRWLMPLAWGTLGLGYLASGVAKMSSPSWVDGSAMTIVLNGPVARDHGLVTLAGSLPMPVLRISTWGFLALELAFAFLILFRTTRAVAWVAMTIGHIFILLLLDVTVVSLAMLIFHSFIVDLKWLHCETRSST